MPFLNYAIGSIITIIVGIITWAFNINSRMAVHDSSLTNLKERQDGILVSLKERQDEQSDSLEKLISSKFDDVGSRLERIERSMNGHLQKD